MHLNKRNLAMVGVILSLGLLLIPFNNCSSSHDRSLSSAALTENEILSSVRSQSALVLQNNCVSCHNQSTTDNPLTNVLDIDDLDSNGYVDLGSPQNSLLYLRIIDGTMPPSPASLLSVYDLNIIRDWIAVEGGNFDTYIGGTPIDPGGDGRPASFNDVRQVLNQNCVSCHLAGGNAPRLDVDANTFRNTSFNGQPLVIPNNASGSLLLDSFNRMPTGGALGVNSAAGNIVRSWINGGAQ